MQSKVQTAMLDLRPLDGREAAETLFWDGRLDNRADLLFRLGASLAAARTNAALAAEAYDRWGTDGLVHLIGDWSAVLCDRRTGTIVLASDFAGVRPLYYAFEGSRVLWSSDLQALVDASDARELDEQYVAGLLTFGRCPNRTPYQGILSVPPGHAVCVSASGVSIRRFWNLPVADEIRYRDERRYEEQFRSLFEEAVAVRLQTGSPVLAELSGGLDSSSVVSMASRLIRSGAVAVPSLHTVSYLWRNSLDEPFVRDMESFCGIEGFHISTHEDPVISAAQVGRAMPEPFAPVRSATARIADRLGARVLLTGQGGDLMMGNWFDDSLQVASHLRRLQLRRACKEAIAWSRILTLPVYWTLWRALRAALPPSLAPARVYTMPDGSYVAKSSETSLAPAFAGRTEVFDPRRFFSNGWMQAPPERRKHFQALSSMLEQRTLKAPEPFQHLEYTHPFAHRPLVEFLMSVPADVLCGPGEPRRLMRRALADLWPARLQKRRSKSLFGAPWQEALRPMAGQLLASRELEVVSRGFVDRDSLRSRLERLSAGLDCNAHQLQQIVLLEFWLRHRWQNRNRRLQAQAA
ncbi:MAG TPA: asparagine synthase-related protein [Bryobacteraceae bacterium]|nr:asparagine synthase-related protein [Bryobacteraceae bacterium]